MSTNLKEIADHLESEGLNFTRETDGFITLGYEMDVYENPDQKKRLRIFIYCERGGSLVRIVSPRLYKVSMDLDSRRLNVIKNSLNQLNWESSIAKYEMDDRDGEIRLGLDLLIEDAFLTKNQLVQNISALLSTAERMHLALKRAIEEGVPVAHFSVMREELGAYLRKKFRSAKA
jgi:hypothetical protein